MQRTSVLATLSLPVLLGACAAPEPEVPPFDAVSVAAEIEEQLRAEVQRFESRDCAAVVAFYGDQEPLFVVSGRQAMPRRADLEAACPGIVSRIPDGASRPVASQRVYALGPDSGYSVTQFRIRRGPNGERVSQFVTKVWERSDSGWRIVHVHESVEEVSS